MNNEFSRMGLSVHKKSGFHFRNPLVFLVIALGLEPRTL